MLDKPEAIPREWTVGLQRVVLADCLAGMASLPPDSIDVCVTSPPYNIGVAYRTYRDRMPRAAYLDWLGEVGRAIHRVLRPAGSFFLNVGSTGSDPWIATDAGRAMGDAFVLQNHIAWVKSLSIGEDSVGHFKPITSPRFLNQNHEAIFHFTKTGTVAIDRLAVGVPFKDKSQYRALGTCAGPSLRRQRLVHPLSDGEVTPREVRSSGRFSGGAAAAVHSASRSGRAGRARPVFWAPAPRWSRRRASARRASASKWMPIMPSVRCKGSPPSCRSRRPHLAVMPEPRAASRPPHLTRRTSSSCPRKRAPS